MRLSARGFRCDSATTRNPGRTCVFWRGGDFYGSKAPAAADAFLVVEISDTTLRYDREVKLPHYAAAGIPECWIADLEAGVLGVHREPSGREYAASRGLALNDDVSVLAFPDTFFKVGELLG